MATDELVTKETCDTKSKGDTCQKVRESGNQAWSGREGMGGLSEEVTPDKRREGAMGTSQEDGGASTKVLG